GFGLPGPGRRRPRRPARQALVLHGRFQRLAAPSGRGHPDQHHHSDDQHEEDDAPAAPEPAAEEDRESEASTTPDAAASAEAPTTAAATEAAEALPASGAGQYDGKAHHVN